MPTAEASVMLDTGSEREEQAAQKILDKEVENWFM